jgi:hypothetical protein
MPGDCLQLPSPHDQICSVPVMLVTSQEMVMKSLLEPVAGASAPHASASVMFRSARSAFAALLRRARVNFEGARKVEAEQELHTQLSKLSDTDLAMRGLDREQLTDLAKTRFR